MPSIYQVGLPIPHDYNEFEDMVGRYFSSVWGEEFQKYGRQGQKQSGVDLIYKSIGVQCKNFYNTQLTVAMIKKEIEAAEKLDPPLTEYYIVTTAQRDVKVQDYVRKYKGIFSVEIYYWDVIENFLLQNSNIKDLYYSQDNNSTTRFIKKYLEICYRYNFYWVMKNNNFVSAIQQESFFVIDSVAEEISKLIHSSLAYGVDAKAMSDIQDFRNRLNTIADILQIVSTPNQNGISNPQFDLNNKEDLAMVEEIEKCSIEAFELYKKYKQIL